MQGSFKRLEYDDFIVSTDAVSATLWSGNVPELTAFYTSSTQEASAAGDYYLSIYQTASSDASAAVQFDIAYANEHGSGSALYNSAVTGSSPSRSVYGQYRNLILEDENGFFVFGNVTQSDFYVINFERSRYKEKLFLGSFNLTLSGSGAGANLKLTDDSNDINTVVYNGVGRVYQLISGSNGTSWDGGTGYTTNSGSYGLLLPDVGMALLNAAALDLTVAGEGIGLNTNRDFDANTGLNNRLLYNAINGGASFFINSEETISSNFVFVRSRNSEFNYSSNPSFISGSTGEVLFSSFIDSPTTYATTIGLYNDNNDLVAVAKLSRPIEKDFTKENLVRVKLDF